MLHHSHVDRFRQESFTYDILIAFTNLQSLSNTVIYEISTENLMLSHISTLALYTKRVT